MASTVVFFISFSKKVCRGCNIKSTRMAVPFLPIDKSLSIIKSLSQVSLITYFFYVAMTIKAFDNKGKKCIASLVHSKMKIMSSVTNRRAFLNIQYMTFKKIYF